MSLESLLDKNKKNLIGVGHYSAVFRTKNPNYVLKIGISIDDPWLHYARLIEKYDSKHFLKIKKLVFCQNYYTAIIEKLNENISLEKVQLLNMIIFKDKELPVSLQKALTVLDKHLKSNITTDFSLNNLMYRDSDLVFSDPYKDIIIKNKGLDSWFPGLIKDKNEKQNKSNKR